MKNISRVFILISALILLSSCVKENIYQKIDMNGQSQLKVDIDMSGLAAISKSFSSGATVSTGTVTINSSTGSDICFDSQIKDTGNFTDSKCESTGPYKATITGGSDLTKDNFLTSSGDVLIHDLKSIDKIMSKKGENKSSAAPKAQSNSDNNQMDQKALGMEVTYTIEYPGEIIKSDIGVVTGNQVKIDVFELQKLDKAFVISKLPVGSTVGPYVVPVVKKIKNIRFKILNPKQQAQVTKFVNGLSEEKIIELKGKVENTLNKLGVKKEKALAETKKINILQDILLIIKRKIGN